MNDEELNILKAQADLNEYKTNHILHLILSILTAGTWLIVWILVAASNSNKRYKALQTIQNGGKKKFSLGFIGLFMTIIGGLILIVLVINLLDKFF